MPLLCYFALLAMATSRPLWQVPASPPNPGIIYRVYLSFRKKIVSVVLVLKFADNGSMTQQERCGVNFGRVQEGSQIP